MLRTTRLQWRLRGYLIAYLFILPATALYTIFVLRPVVDVARLSFYEWNGISPVKNWEGIDNFIALFHDPIFWQAFRHNLLWLVILVFFNVCVGLVTAVLIASDIRGRTFFRLAYFLPVVQAPLATALIWKWMYTPDGVINSILKAIGLGSLARGWLGEEFLALPSLAIAASWASFGLSVVIFLAGLQNVDQTLYEAARIDGANGIQIFWHVTIPALRNIITIVTLLAIIAGFQVFDIVWATTQGGPVRSTEMLVTYMFKTGIMQAEYGYGSAIAVVIGVIILSISVLYLALRERGSD